MSLVAGAKFKGHQFGWDFGDRVCSKKGDVLMAATTQAVGCTEVPADDP